MCVLRLSGGSFSTEGSAPCSRPKENGHEPKGLSTWHPSGPTAYPLLRGHSNDANGAAKPARTFQDARTSDRYMGALVRGGMIRTGVARALILAVVALTAPACDESAGRRTHQNRSARVERQEPSKVVIWGCDQAIPEPDEHLDPRWREEATVVGDFGFNLTAGDFSGFRRHTRADIEVKLPVTIEGHSVATVWVPRHERDRVALLLANIPRRGPGNSYRIEDGHQGIRFEPCPNKRWSAWTAGLALDDRKEIVLKVKVDGARRPARVTLGPWASFTLDR